jgi:hypothetical protein
MATAVTSPLLLHHHHPPTTAGEEHSITTATVESETHHCDTITSEATSRLLTRLADPRIDHVALDQYIPWSCILRNGVVLVEASAAVISPAVGYLAREVVQRTPQSQWDDFRKHVTRGVRTGGLRGLVLHVFTKDPPVDTSHTTSTHNSNHTHGKGPQKQQQQQRRSSLPPLRIFTYACVYYSTRLRLRDVQLFLEEVVACSEVLREEDASWTAGTEYACQESFYPTLLRRMKEFSFLGRRAATDRTLQYAQEIIESNQILLGEKVVTTTTANNISPCHNEDEGVAQESTNTFENPSGQILNSIIHVPSQEMLAPISHGSFDAPEPIQNESNELKEVIVTSAAEDPTADEVLDPTADEVLDPTEAEDVFIISESEGSTEQVLYDKICPNEELECEGDTSLFPTSVTSRTTTMTESSNRLRESKESTDNNSNNNNNNNINMNPIPGVVYQLDVCNNNQTSFDDCKPFAKNEKTANDNNNGDDDDDDDSTVDANRIIREVDILLNMQHDDLSLLTEHEIKVMMPEPEDHNSCFFCALFRPRPSVLL